MAITTRAPQSTYRLQLHARFGFDDVAAVADYLERLGISHVYCSPYLQAAAGSTHGYDVVDPRRVNRELGGEPGHSRMCAALDRCHLGQVLDIVPNHMSIADRDNLWWWDVLENGQSSRYAAYFDVQWHPPEQKLHNTVLLPILGDHYGRVIEAREITLERQEGSFNFRYHERVLPVAPRSLDHLLASAAERCNSETLAYLADALGKLPLSTATDRTSIARRHRDKEVLRQQLARLCAEQPHVAAAIDQVVSELNVEPDALDALLERQNYRIAFWRTAGQELGYRRFFDINSLISLRMEDDQVFTETHGLVLQWLKRGVIDGLRIDHPDGLRDPEEYLDRLRAAAPEAWIVVEKILEPGEPLPPSWPVAGTSGYDFIHRVGGVLLDPAGEPPLTAFYREFTGESADYDALVHANKLRALEQMFGSDVHRLADLFSQVCERHRRYRDYTRQDLRAVLCEVIACLRVYRTYLRPYSEQISETDNAYLTASIEAAKIERADLDVDLFHFFRDLLLLRIRGNLESELVARFQQLSGAVMAKGVEDTTFYAFNRLISLNEVGDDPGRFGVTLEEFHRACEEVQRLWPQTMLAGSTHDTKRSEDVRARIGLLSEMPHDWRDAVLRWSRRNDRHWVDCQPDRNAEYFYYQTLFGAWPIGVERATAYMEKAVREAKVYTSWNNVNVEYERAIRQFVTATLEDKAFLADFTAFQTPYLEAGRTTSLAQTLIKLTAPGVPDTYQGSELWDLNLVDPDNRRPVDFELRRRLLAEAEPATCQEALARPDEGLPKLWMIRRTLHLRRERPEAFGASGTYLSLVAQGAKAQHVVAFLRGEQVVTVVPRWLVRLDGAWSDTALRLPERGWRNLFDDARYPGGDVRLSDLLGRFPVALLVAEEEE